MNYDGGMRNVLLLVVFTASAAAQDAPLSPSASLYVLPVEPAVRATPSTQSILFDVKAAEDLRLRSRPIYVESITIVGQGPEPPKKTLERKFADTLNAPVSGMVEFRQSGSTPCLSMASTRPDIGSWFTPATGCPQ
jgi:hypothetical protein